MWKLCVLDKYHSGLFSRTVFCNRITSFTCQCDTSPMKKLFEYQSRCGSSRAESTGRGHLLRVVGTCSEATVLAGKGLRGSCWFSEPVFSAWCWWSLYSCTKSVSILLV